MKNRLAIVAGLALAAVPAMSQTIDTYPFWDGGVTSGWERIGQSFDAPNSMLKDLMFGINGGTGSINVSVYNWIAGSGPTGGALYSNTMAWPSSTGDVVLTGINVPMTTSGHYGFVVDLLGSTASSVHWMGNTTGNPSGHGYWYMSGSWDTSFTGLSTKFKAEFGPVPEPASLAVLGLGAAALLRRRLRRQ